MAIFARNGRVSLLRTTAIWPSLLAGLCAVANSGAQEPAPAPEARLEVPRVRDAVRVDGDLGEWNFQPQLQLADAKLLLPGGAGWTGADDASCELQLAYDSNCLYLAGRVRDDHRQPDLAGAAAGDRLDLFFGLVAGAAEGSNVEQEELQLALFPLSQNRPWAALDPRAGTPRQGGSAMTGLQLVSRDAGDGTYVFEASIPFHQLACVRPGQSTIPLDITWTDTDPAKEGAAVEVARWSWTGADPLVGPAHGALTLRGNGPLQSELPARLLTLDLLNDLRYLLVPLIVAVALVVTLRAWPRLRTRMRWLRPTLLSAGVVATVLGLALPALWSGIRDRSQQSELAGSVATVRGLVEQLEQGTLASYRGASRDRALMDLLAGKSVARQKYTSYRFLSQIAPDEFGGALREYPDEPFQVRPYWLPLDGERTESFQFDPPLSGEELYVVLGRPFASAVPMVSTSGLPPAVELLLNSGTANARSETVYFDGDYVAGGVLSREASEADWHRIPLKGPLRTLGIRLPQGGDVRLVGLTLLRERDEPAEPLFLGTPSLDGVLTDLRSAHPREAGIELVPGSVRRVEVPSGQEPCNKLWLFYRATYPGVPTANPGATVAEVVLHFRNGVPSRTLKLEHQVSMFYELVVHNTRDQPPEGSPASIAFSWIDEQKERHINMALPVLDLPAGAEFEAIEFKNLSDYRMRFRSVVFGSDKAAAPQDPEDSPLVREGQDRRLRDDVRASLAGAEITIYRDASLSESTLPLDVSQDFAVLPRDAAMHGNPETPLVVTTKAGATRASVFVPLAGEGWDGAVLGVSRTDPERPAAQVTASRTGLLLCLVGAPLLIVLLGELLAFVANLRARLMAVLSVAVLAPLVVLSFVLAQVIDRGHETDQEEAMRRQVENATGQLADQMQRLRASAQQWIQDLSALYTARTSAAADEALRERVGQAMPELQQLLAGQLPPEWKGGFLKLEWSPAQAGRADQVVTTVAGDARLASAEVPARLDPGIYLQWGSVVIAVRSESAVRGGMLALTVSRPLGADLLGALAPGASVLLCDPRGYPLEVAGSRVDPKALLDHGRDAASMLSRERAMFAALDQRRSVVQRVSSAFGDWLCGYAALRDLQDTPRALLTLAQPDQPATLDLSIGRIPVRAFFVLVAGLLLVLSAFVAFVVSSRISRPIEQIERGAQLLADGQLEARVPVDEKGQLGQLARTFNKMAGDLQGRLFDLETLNRAMRELSSQLDENHTIAVLRRFCEEHVAADRIRIAVLDPDAGKVDLHGGAEVERLDLAPTFSFLSRALGPFALCRVQANFADLLARLPSVNSMVGVPMVVGGRCRGAVLLGFHGQRPGELDLQLLATVAAQAAVALDNAQLYSHAVMDPVTGTFGPDYFRRRVAEEVAVAQSRGAPLALVALGLGDGASRPRGLRRFAAVLREHLPRGGLLCHSGAGQFQLLAPNADRSAGEALVLRVLEAWQRVVEQAQESDIEDKRPTSALAVFPEEAASAEFLFEVLRHHLASGSALTPAAVEVDASLRRAGITATSPAMREVYRTLRRVAPTDLGVLFLGETGSGKEVLTNLLHRWSRRANGPLVKVHCAALSETLLASELFGHEKGAFTGADRRKVGKFEQANGGTIFLDEVGEIPLDVQVKLLRVLQEREVDRVGGAEPVPIDVRVVAATNRDIAQMVADGRFREDLYYRLQGIVVQVPPLRDRRQEIPGLVEQFRSEVAASGESRVRGFATDAMDELFRREWPGNIRELRNAVYRAMVLATGELVERRDVFAALPVQAGGAGGGLQPLPPMPAASPAAPAVAPGAINPAAGPSLPPVAEAGGSLPVPSAPPSGLPAGVRPAEAVAPVETQVEVPAELPASVDDAGASGGEAEAPPSRQTGAGPVVLDSLPPRIRVLYDQLVEKGSIGTQDHMTTAGVSHRTGLRDLQTLVELGLAERVGTRRGARYRPIGGQ